MKVLLDTHILLWASFEPHKLSVKHRAILEDPTNIIFVSSMSSVEIIIKHSIGKLDIDLGVLDNIEEMGFELLDYSNQDALTLKELPMHHRDPFDRMLIAQSMNRGLKLMSEDTKFDVYNCDLV
jgi:PIN domain nuclease of toxin-antitoxin system